MEKLPIPPLSQEEVLESYKHIQLTHEEETEGLIWAKMKKEKLLQAEKIKSIQEENRKALTNFNWSIEQTKSFMLFRAGSIFKRQFVVDQNNYTLYDLLCAYFSNDPVFESHAKQLGMENISLKKGVLLAGNFGTGKTWMMQLFSKNQRQVFHIRNAKYIADAFSTDGEIISEGFSELIKNPINDRDSFFHLHAGLCIDDMGTESVKNHYGNKKNVIGDLIESRYFKKNTGVYLHATTNLSVTELEKFYGERVTSRMREIFNFIEVIGEDRRK